MKKILPAALALIVSLTISTPSAKAAGTIDTWTGVSGNDWSGASNWSAGKPGSADTALFNSNISSVTNSSGVDQSVSSITFDTGAGSITIGSTGGNKLLLTSGGSITMANTLTTTGLIETVNSPLVIGTATAGAQAYTIADNYTDMRPA